MSLTAPPPRFGFNPLDRGHFRVLLCLGFLLIPAQGNDVVVTGQDGLSGTTPGPAGSSSTGTPGTSGGNAVAVAQSGDAENTATARGGRGGHGGSGGDPAGHGGNGGAAGTADAATVTAIVAGSAVAGSLATGGEGGGGGDAGGTVNGAQGTGGDGLPGGNAMASGSATSGVGPASVSAAAAGGNGGGGTGGGTAGDGGSASLGTVFGSSGSGGAVTVNATVDAGAGGTILLENDDRFGVAGRGADATLIDALNGTTTGTLVLSQQVYAGAGGNSVNGPAGRAGDARSELGRTLNAGSLTVNAGAYARAGGNSFKAGQPGTAGAASVTAEGENLTGPVDVIAVSRGGAGGSAISSLFSIPGKPGGAAAADGSGRSHGDGRPVSVSATTEGGSGGTSANNAGGNGADGTATSLGLAGGTGLVSSRASATGGGGGQSPNPGTGGPASATARAGLAVTTTAALSATAGALGGSGGQRTGGGVSGPGGDAEATSIVEGIGSATSRSDAVGGHSTNGGNGGTGLARAQAAGNTGTALANAESTGGLMTYLFSSAYTEVAGLTETQSRAAVNRPAADRAITVPLNASVFSTGLPMASDVAAALAGNPSVADALPAGSQFLCLGVAGIRHPPVAGIINAEVRTALRLNVAQLAAPANLKIGFLDPLVTGNGFSSLRLQIFRQLPPGNLLSTVLDQTFPDAAAALVFFNDRFLDLGPISSGVTVDNTQSFQIVMQVNGSAAGDGFNANFLVANAPFTALPPDLEIFATRRAGPAFRFEVSTLAGKTYRAQYSGTLAQGSWQFLGDSFPGTGSTVTVSDPVAFLQMRRLYNVVRID